MRDERGVNGERVAGGSEMRKTHTRVLDERDCPFRAEQTHRQTCTYTPAIGFLLAWSIPTALSLCIPLFFSSAWLWLYGVEVFRDVVFWSR